MTTATAPRTHGTDAPTPRDRARQVTVTLAEVFCVLGTLVGVGVLGTAVESSSGGSLSADATLVAPAGPAFSIWSVVYAGLAVYTVLQWLPSRATAPRDRAIGWLVAASMVLNAGWLLVTQQGWVALSVVVILALLAVLVVLVHRLQREPRTDGLVDRVVVDGTFGLYLGWVAVATLANIAAALTDAGVTVSRTLEVGAALLAVVVVVAGSYALARGLGGRWAPALATAWGLAWVAVGRTTDEPRSLVVGVAAAVAAVLVLALPIRLRSRG